MRQAVSERRRTRRVIEELTADVEALEDDSPARAAAHTSEAITAGSTLTLPPPATPSRSSTMNRTVRSILIQTAVDRGTLGEAAETAQGRGISSDEVHHVASLLRDSKLLKFADPLSPETRLALS